MYGALTCMSRSDWDIGTNDDNKVTCCVAWMAELISFSNTLSAKFFSPVRRCPAAAVCTISSSHTTCTKAVDISICGMRNCTDCSPTGQCTPLTDPQATRICSIQSVAGKMCTPLLILTCCVVALPGVPSTGELTQHARQHFTQDPVTTDGQHYSPLDYGYYCIVPRFSCQRQGASADKLQGCQNSYFFMDSPHPSKIQSTVRMVLSICTAAPSRGLVNQSKSR